MRALRSDTFAEIDFKIEGKNVSDEDKMEAIRYTLAPANLELVEAKAKKDMAGMAKPLEWHADINVGHGGANGAYLPMVRVVKLNNGAQGTLKMSRIWCTNNLVCHICYKPKCPGHDVGGSSSSFKRGRDSFDDLYYRNQRRR